MEALRDQPALHGPGAAAPSAFGLTYGMIQALLCHLARN